jgi:hypothetical protein
MSNGTTKLKAVNLKTGPTPAQRAWVKQLAAFAGAPVAEDETAGDKRELVRLGPEDIIPGLGIIKGLLTDLTCNCKVVNRTDRVLQLNPNSIDIESGA